MNSTVDRSVSVIAVLVAQGSFLVRKVPYVVFNQVLHPLVVLGRQTRRRIEILKGVQVDEIPKRIHGRQRLAGKGIKARGEIEGVALCSYQEMPTSFLWRSEGRRIEHAFAVANLVTSRDQHLARSLDYSLAGSPYGYDVFDHDGPCSDRYGASSCCHVELVPSIRTPALVVEIRIPFARWASDHHVNLALERKKGLVSDPYLLKLNVGPGTRPSSIGNQVRYVLAQNPKRTKIVLINSVRVGKYVHTKLEYGPQANRFAGPTDSGGKSTTPRAEVDDVQFGPSRARFDAWNDTA